MSKEQLIEKLKARKEYGSPNGHKLVPMTIEEIDAGRSWIERPTTVAPLIDLKYTGMGWMEILRDLVKQGQGQGQGQPGTTTGGFDVHILRDPGDAENSSAAQQAQAELTKQINDAVNQGAIMQTKMRGDKAGNRNALSGFQERTTDWKTPLRRFIQERCEGDDQSRFCPPNKRFLPLGIVMPSHFSEATGELIVACDTSGSMGGVYASVFGEIARICQNVNPEAVRVIWWDTEVNSEQRFLPKDYATIAKVLKPEGGGGTTVSCVADYIKAKKYKPKAVILLTDGYLEPVYRVPDAPCLWGVVDNETWTPRKGSVVRINSLQM